MKILDNFAHYTYAVGAVTIFLLLIPLIAMQFTNEVAWTFTDFIFAAIILSGSGITFGLVARRMANSAFRLAVALSVAASLFLIWVNGAVGIIGSENNDANLMYVLVLVVVFLGGVLSRLKPRGLALTMFVAAGMQFLVPIVALVIWKSTGLSQQEFWGSAGLFRVFVFNAFFVLMYTASGLLFNQSEENQNRASLS